MSLLVKNHMVINWDSFIDNGETKNIKNSSLSEKSAVVGRVGMLLLSCGASAWRVRDAMNIISQNLEIVCIADIGLLSITYNCMDDNSSYSQVFSLKTTAVNTDKLTKIENFVKCFKDEYINKSGREIHKKLNEIEKTKELYSTLTTSLAAAFACSAFAFLLGGGVI